MMENLSDALKFKEQKMVCQEHGEQTERGIMGQWFGCPVCKVETARKENQQRADQARLDAVKEIGIPDAYQTATLSNWVVTDDAQKPVLRRLKLYIDQLIKPKAPNLVLSGNTGTGKTRLTAIILRNAANRGARCKFVPAADLMGEIRMSWDSKTRTKFEVEVIRHYGSIPVLVLDELGIADSLPKSHEVWSSLFDQRYRNRLPTIITTNLTKDQLKTHIGDRAYDRLMESVIWGNCVWQSYREINQNVEEI